MVRINGKELEVSGLTVDEYLKTAGYIKSRVAVERNGKIVPKSDYDKVKLIDGDSVEIVGFVGGG